MDRTEAMERIQKLINDKRIAVSSYIKIEDADAMEIALGDMKKIDKLGIIVDVEEALKEADAYVEK